MRDSQIDQLPSVISLSCVLMCVAGYLLHCSLAVLCTARLTEQSKQKHAVDRIINQKDHTHSARHARTHSPLKVAGSWQ